MSGFRAIGVFLLALVAGCLAVSGASPAAIPLVRAHAESDIDCPQSDIRVEDKLGGRFVAIGCGRKAAYKAACEGLSCVVYPDDGRAIPWRDRPDPTPLPN